MAAHTIAANAIGVHARTLTANVEDTVTFTDRYESTVTLIVHPGGSDPVYVTIDGAAATVGGARARIVFPGYAVDLKAAGVAPTVLRLISAAAATYSVEGGS